VLRTIACAVLLCGTLAAQAAGYRIQTLAEGLEHPWSLAFLPDGRMLVSERPGRLRVIMDGELLPAPVAGVPAVYAASQGGLLEVLPDPGFADNGLLYLSFAHGTPRANATRVVRARLDGMTLHAVEPIFTARPGKRTPVHYGGRMAFLPDGTLVIGLGDGFDYREQAQRLDSHLGKIVRIRPDGSVPDDNPFVGRADALPEIWSLGHRNVQGLVYDAERGALFSHEHGPRGGDELNRIVPGGNYGWPLATHGVDYTGARITPFTEYPGTQAPLWQWTPSIAPAGLARYDGDLFPHWRGDLFVAALAARQVRRLRLHGDAVIEEETLFAELGERLRDVRAGPDGALYLLTDSPRGRLLRVRPAD
jgi:glucose/arabinose dehydrogenase